VIAEPLMSILLCPACGGRPLRLDTDEVSDDQIISGSLGCPDCKRWHRVTDDIPTLMPPELAASLRAVGSRWEQWREALEQFVVWRERVWRDPGAAVGRAGQAAAMHERFIAFCELPAGPYDCLDIGCGSGHLADLLAEECSYVGIDPLPGGRIPGRELPERMPRPSRPVAHIQGVGEVLPFVDDCFDVALIAGALDHCRDPEQVLEEASRALRPGGKLCVLQGIARRRGGIGGALRQLGSKLRGGADADASGTHLHRFSAEELRSLLAAKFEPEAESMDESSRLFIRASKPPGGR
jgi:ubiquinone/menaquinone biosynthesis C-methylase UbiE/uncharacterized protein YbaR (Trm112 family)